MHLEGRRQYKERSIETRTVDSPTRSTFILSYLKNEMWNLFASPRHQAVKKRNHREKGAWSSPFGSNKNVPEDDKTANDKQVDVLKLELEESTRRIDALTAQLDNSRLDLQAARISSTCCMKAVSEIFHEFKQKEIHLLAQKLAWKAIADAVVATFLNVPAQPRHSDKKDGEV